MRNVGVEAVHEADRKVRLAEAVDGRVPDAAVARATADTDDGVVETTVTNNLRRAPNPVRTRRRPPARDRRNCSPRTRRSAD